MTIARTSAETLRTPANIAAIFGLIYIVTFLATYYAARFSQKDAADESAVVALTLGFPNLAGVGLPLLAALYGAGGKRFRGRGTRRGGSHDHSDYPRDSRKQLHGRRRSIARGNHPDCNLEELEKPVFWAPMAGVVLVLLHFQLPIGFGEGFRDSRQRLGRNPALDHGGAPGRTRPTAAANSGITRAASNAARNQDVPTQQD